jgi:Ca2+/Na+ antiporter
MKALLKILLLVLFAIVIFMPMNKIAQGAYWSLFLLMFFVLYLYYRFSYWVGEGDIASVDNREIRFSAFSGKVPPMSSEDLVRGRLVVFDDEIALYQRSRNPQTGEKAKKVWSVAIDDLSGFSIGKVIGIRGGLILSLVDGDEARFAIFFMKNKKIHLMDALGWSGGQSE